MNPKAGYELQLKDIDKPVANPKHIAVVGAGPAGLAFATQAGRHLGSHGEGW